MVLTFNLHMNAICGKKCGVKSRNNNVMSAHEYIDIKAFTNY